MEILRHIGIDLAAASIGVAAILIPGRSLEWAFPLRKNLPARDAAFAARYAIALQILLLGISPAAAVLSSIAIRSLGAGLIILPMHGPWFAVSLAIYLLSAEFLEYWWHRAEHTFAPLWAMHSFHHSDESLSVWTTWRDFWLSGGPLKSLLLYTPLAMVFRTPSSVLLTTSMLHMAADVLMHVNAKIELGRFSLCFMNPQFHRIHHSVEERHWNKNFSVTLPLWDLVFGTAWIPAKGEFPETGLMPSFTPGGIIEALLWPARFIRQRNATAPGLPSSAETPTATM